MNWTKEKIYKTNQYWLCIITHVLIGFPTFSQSFSSSDFHNISIYFDLIIQISVRNLLIWKNLFVTHHKFFKIYPLTELNLWNKCIKIAWFMFLIELGPRIFFFRNALIGDCASVAENWINEINFWFDMDIIA